MNRGSFLKRAGVVVGALAFGKMPASTEKPIVEAETWTNAEPIVFPTATSLVASGGLCAPVTPHYSLAWKDGDWIERPLRDSLPTMKVGRGGINYDGKTPVRPATFPESWLDDDVWDDEEQSYWDMEE